MTIIAEASGFTSRYLSRAVALIFVLAIFGAAQTAEAADKCCTCIHPQLTAEKFCITTADDCTKLSSGANNDLKAFSCTQIPDTEMAAKCKPKPQGICHGSPIVASAFKLADLDVKLAPAANTNASDGGFKGDTVKLNVPLGELKELDAAYKEDTYVVANFYAQYVSAFQKYIIGIGLLAAAVITVYGGFLYIAVATGAKTKEGKKIIIDALIGLVILLCSYVILYNVNPATTVMKSLNVQFIDAESPDLGNYGAGGESQGTAVEGGGADAVRSDGFPDKQSVIEGIKWGAKETGVDACALLAICQHESGFKWLWTSAFNGKTTWQQAGAVGPCGTMAFHLKDENGRYNKILRAKFSDYPPPGSSLDDKKLYILKNPNAAGYFSAVIFKACAATSGSAAGALSCYSAGGASWPKWLNAHPECKAVMNKNASFKEASKNVEEIKKCLPDYIGIPQTKCVERDNNGKCKKSEIDWNQACPNQKYECGNVKTNQRGEFWGTCADGTVCLAMKLSDFIPYVLKHYESMKAYGCDK